MESQQLSQMAIEIAPRTAECIARGAAVVALETAVFTHGLPQDEALPCFGEVQCAVHEEGAEPATCGVLAGRPTVGISPRELERLMSARADKASPATMPHSIGQGRWAGTTAGATMMLAHRAGIRVVATGGIGGVHRGDGRDVSGDLTCLARLPLIVVCSGPKAILDLAATMEALETRGVTVVGYRTDELPGFYTRSTGLPLPGRVDSPRGIAAVWLAARSVGSVSSIVVMNPPPAELAFDASAVETAVEFALPAAHGGPGATPIQLKLVQDRLGIRSVQLNRALLVANARLAAQVGIVISQEGYSR